MPPDLRVQLGPIELATPVICASGEWVASGETIRAALDAGAAAVVAKSANESEAARRQLEAAAAVRLAADRTVVEDGPSRPGETLLNRSGLVGMPFDEWAATLGEADRYARTRGAYVAASLVPGDPGHLVELVRELEAAGLRWLELNVGAAHGEEAAAGAILLASAPEGVRNLVGTVRDAASMALTVKLPGTGDVLGMAEAAAEAGADAVCLAGRPLGFLPDLETRRPLLGTFGAVGGSWALPLTLRWVAKARARLGPELPLLATNGIRSGGDVARALLAGATAVEIGTVVWTDGFGALGRVTRDLEAYLDECGEDARDIVGEAADAVLTYEEVVDELDRHVR
jgi:dihydroorotate dehydrogenase